MCRRNAPAGDCGGTLGTALGLIAGARTADVRQNLVMRASGRYGDFASLPPPIGPTPGIANVSTFRAIAASIAAPMRSDPPSATFLFRALREVDPVSPLTAL